MKKAKEITNTITYNSDTRRAIFRFFVVAFSIIGLVYGYLILSITFNLVSFKSLKLTAENLNSEISKLELTYFENINKIDREYLKSKGFIEVDQNIFASREVNQVAIR